jgi:hypothetical protein
LEVNKNLNFTEIIVDYSWATWCSTHSLPRLDAQTDSNNG